MSITRAVFSLKHRRGARYQSANAFPAIYRDRSDGDRSNNDNGRTSAVIADYVIVIRAFFLSFRPKCGLYICPAKRTTAVDYMKKRYAYYYIKYI